MKQYELIQVKEFGPYSHSGTTHQVKWYRQSSFFVRDFPSTKLVVMHERLSTFLDLAEEFLQVDWAISDYQKEYRYFWEDTVYCNSIREDLEEYEYYLSTLAVDESALLAELIQESTHNYLNR